MRRLTTCEFIEKSINIHGDIYDYSNSLYINNRTKIDIICKIHGIFKQNPAAHLSGQGCPYCGQSITKVLTSVEFINKSVLKHGLLYD